MTEAKEPPARIPRNVGRRDVDRLAAAALADSLPDEWPEARPKLTRILRDHAERHDDTAAQIGAHQVLIERQAEDIHVIRQCVEGFAARVEKVADQVERGELERTEMRVKVQAHSAIVNGVMLAVATAISLFFIKQWLGDNGASSTIDQRQARLEAIAEVMPHIPRDAPLRVTSGPYRGAPTVPAVSAMLRQVDPQMAVVPVSARERDEACQLLARRGEGGVCRP